MLSFTFLDIFLSLFYCTSLLFLWNLYYVYINNITTPVIEPVDSNISKLPNITTNMYSVLPGIFILFFNFYNYIYIQNNSTGFSYWDTIYISNNTSAFVYISILVLITIMSAITCLKKQNISFSIEYLLFVILIMLSGFFLISSTNLFMSIFFLEFIALLIFAKFTVSRVVVNITKINLTKPDYLIQYSYGLFNSLFFQFWANFVSSIFLFFSLINVHYMFGTSNFYIINYLFNIINLNWFFSEFFITSIIILFLTGLFIKLGLSPYQFFKIETYKGIPLFMVIVYTTVYLVIYIYFFIFLFCYQFTSLKGFIECYLIFFIVLSLLYLISLLFDTKNFKAFLSYSTLITIVNILIVLLTV